VQPSPEIGLGPVDSLTGTSGASTIIGGGGADTIKGGGGADILTGGQGPDRFIFAALTDSAPSARDLITDFVPGSDIIDLSAIDANTGTDDAYKLWQPASKKK